MLALVDARANAPEKQQEVLALVIDRETSAEVSRINQEIGHSVYRREVRGRWGKLNDQARLWEDWHTSYEAEQHAVLAGQDPSYGRLLNEYVGIKLYLHDLRRSMYYRGDPYCEREDVDVKSVMERCDELKQMIKAKRKIINFAAWGGMEPQKATALDKPLLYAFDEYTCSMVPGWSESPDDNENVTCPLKGEHWYHGRPYCRAHLGEARRQFKLEKRQNRIRWECNEEPKCGRKQPHWHSAGRPHYASPRDL